MDEERHRFEADYTTVSAQLMELFVMVSTANSPMLDEIQRGSALAQAGLLDAARALIYGPPPEKPPCA